MFNSQPITFLFETDMDSKNLTKVALRYRAVLLDVSREHINLQSEPTAPVLAFVARLRENGFCVSEELLHALNGVSADRLAEVTECINDVMGVHLNWAALVKGWDVPTGETAGDHLITWFVNAFSDTVPFRGTTLPCGHLIPEGTFPLERYNGCPFCGTPFETADFVYKGQGSKLKELRLFTLVDLQQVLASLLASATPLDGTQRDSLELLLREFPLPEQVDVAMRETAMLVVRLLVEQGRDDEAARLLRTPTDVLRYLWYEKTGRVQILEPKTLVAHARRLYAHIWEPLDRSADAAAAMKAKLKLKYDRKACLRVARWMNALPLSARQAAENMNAKRGMWVRVIRALRLAEYAHKRGFGPLAELLDVFYRQDYVTWQGRVDRARMQNDADQTLSLLKERPGLFARCLFATMLRLGSERVLAAFQEVTDKLPARLLLSLGNAADAYFDPKEMRLARPITGGTHKVEPNKLLALYGDEDRQAMVSAVNNLYRASMAQRFAAQKTASKTMYIDPQLWDIPVGVGDRSATIQDASCALTGTRFPVEGDAVRLFLQWGKGLHAQPLDMDLSCRIFFDDDSAHEDCAYYNLTCTGAKHSGDIRSIPEMVGTAEYIELSLPELAEAGAKYVVFTCNAYSTGALTPNLVVGWMNSAYKMKVSEKKGVAYDPSCVQHMVRISENDLSKGLVFGVLDVSQRVIIWLEMPLGTQTVRGVGESSETIEALLRRLESKLSVGELLEMKAKAQNLKLVENKDDADEAYTYQWAMNAAEVTKLLNAE